MHQITRKLPVFGSLCLGLVLPLGLPLLTSAAEVENSLNVSGQYRYDSNPRRRTDPEAVQKYSLIPTFNSRWSTEINVVNFSGSYRLERSDDRSLSKDRDDPRLTVDWTGRRERGELSLNGSYEERSTQESELDDSGLIFFDSTNIRKSVGGGFTRTLTERTSLLFDSSYTESEYTGEGDFIDHSTWRNRLSTSLVTGETSQVNLSLSSSHHKSDIPANQTTPTTAVRDRVMYMVSLGGSWQLSEAMTLTSSLGGARQEERNSWDLNGGINLNYRAERLSASVGLNRSTSSGSGGNFREADVLNSEISYQLSPTMQAGAGVRYRDNRTGRQITASNYELWLTKSIGRDFQLRFSLQRREQDADFVTHSQVATVGLRYTVF